MKVCPKCNSSYSDETLNFCLTDGVPLVSEEVLDENLSRESSWHQAETLLDPRFSAPPSSRPTTINPSAPTIELGNTTANTVSFNRSNKTLYAVLSVFVAAILVGSGFWWFSKATPANSNTAVLNDSKPTTPKRAVVELSPEQEAQVKKELSAFMQTWVNTNSQKNADAHLDHYANTLEIWYTESNKDKNYVLADRLRAYKRYDTIQMQVDNLKITPESTESATVVFDKSWTMRNAQRTSTGSVQQEMHISKHDGQWLIDSEKDLKVYFLNNRDNPAAENTNPPKPEPQSANSATQLMR